MHVLTQPQKQMSDLHMHVLGQQKKLNVHLPMLAKPLKNEADFFWVNVEFAHMLTSLIFFCGRQASACEELFEYVHVDRSKKK